MIRERAALAVSAPLLVGGLAAAALASDWPGRVGGAAMVMGAGLALALTSDRARWLAWALAVVGLAAVLMGLI